MTECLFCQIANSDAPASVVASTEHTMAFLDVRPVFKGHVLLIPRIHVDTLVDLPPGLIQPLITEAQRIAASLVTSLGAEGSSSRSTTRSANLCRTCTSTWCHARGEMGCAASSGPGRNTPQAR